jgi:hypothetical protein
MVWDGAELPSDPNWPIVRTHLSEEMNKLVGLNFEALTQRRYRDEGWHWPVGWSPAVRRLLSLYDTTGISI